MKTKRKTRFTIIVIISVIVMLVGAGIFLNTKQLTKTYAAEITTDAEFDVPVTKINGWRALKNMTTYGPNDDWGCGMTAMGILLQYYNDNSLYAGEILPNEFNYALGSNEMISDLTTDKQARANALRGYSLKESPPDGYVTERNDDLFRLTPRFIGPLADLSWFEGEKNATVAANHKDGLESFFQIHCPDLNIGVEQQTNMVFGVSLSAAKRQINNNRPILLIMFSYDHDYDGGNTGKQKAHVVVAYGYRERNGKTEFLAHSGWGTGTEVWFSPNGVDLFVTGFAYIDAPLDRFNTTLISNGSAVRIDGLKRNAAGKLVIPSHLNGLPVTEIGSNAFSGQTGVTIVTFSNESNITKIGSSAFSGMSNLTNITLPGTLQTIGNNAFANCPALPRIEIPSGVTSIGSSVFSGCTKIADISFGGDNLLNIPDHIAKWYNVGEPNPVRYIERPLNVNLIAGAVYTLTFDYENLSSNTSIIFTNLGIGETKFETSLEKRYFPTTTEGWPAQPIGQQQITFILDNDIISSNKLWVRFIETNATVNYATIEIKNVRLTCDSQLQTIGSSAFSGCTNLSQISIPKSVTSLGNNAFPLNTRVDWEENYSFKGSEFLGILGGQTSFTIPSTIAGRTITSIGNNAFNNCTSLTSLTIPSSITSIGAGMFAGCTSLTAFTVDSSNPNYISIDGVLYTKSQNGSIGAVLAAYPAGKTAASFTVPAGVSYITSYAFSTCTNLEKIILPADDFIYCGFEPFDQNSNLKIIIPHDLSAEYQSNTDWSPYINKFETPESLVTFNPNGGQTVQSITVSYGEKFKLSLPKKDGFTFAGWYDNEGYCYYIYTCWNSLNGTVTLNAAWVNEIYTVDFGENQVIYKIVHTTYNEELPGAKIPVKQACDYICYKIDDGDEIPYYFESGLGAELWNLDDTVLYEDWRLTIEFYSDGGVIETIIEKPGTVIYNITFEPERAGFKFAGWYTEPNGNGEMFSEFTAYFNIKFYAKWECAITFSVTNGEDLLLNYSNAPANAVFTYIMAGKEYSVNISGTSGAHSLINNLINSGNYISSKNVTITLKNIRINESGEEIMYSLKNTSITFSNLFAGGTGTAASPYTINSSRHLKNIEKSPSSSYKLLNSISLTGDWITIPYFSGILDGNNYPIYSLKIIVTNATAAENCGLVGQNYGTIKNLTLSYPIIDINTAGNPGTASYKYVGAFAGDNRGTIQSCYTYGYVNDSRYHIYFYNYNINSYMGGIAGYNSGLIQNCQNNLPLLGYGNMGGIVGYNLGTVTGCINSGYICLEYYWQSSFTLGDNKSVGGIAGIHLQGYGTGSSTITNCTATGSIIYSGSNLSGIANLKPHMGQIIGFKTGGTCSGNTKNNTVNVSSLTTSQQQYAGNREIGRTGG